MSNSGLQPEPAIRNDEAGWNRRAHRVTGSNVDFKENAMRTNWIIAALLGLLLGGCASVETAPTQEERQALAPTGKLRMGLVANEPVFATKDPRSGELRGAGIDLGSELARRLGVPMRTSTRVRRVRCATATRSPRWVPRTGWRPNAAFWKQ